jgi:hypothetical protein
MTIMQRENNSQPHQGNFALKLIIAGWPTDRAKAAYDKAAAAVAAAETSYIFAVKSRAFVAKSTFRLDRFKSISETADCEIE